MVREWRRLTIQNLSVNRKTVPACKLLRPLEGQVSGVQLQAEGVLLQFLEFFVVDAGLAGHDVDAVVGDSQLFLAVILDGIVAVQIDHVVIGLVQTQFFHELSLDIRGEQGSVQSGSFSILHTALIGVGSSRCHIDIGFGAHAISLEKSSSGCLVLAHLVPLAHIVLDFEFGCRRRVSAFLSESGTGQEDQQEKSEHIRKIIIMIVQQPTMNIRPDMCVLRIN